ncbi:MAG: twin-arginine translocase TatA/TatE family subunit [Desulfomonilaceae bacterium]
MGIGTVRTSIDSIKSYEKKGKCAKLGSTEVISILIVVVIAFGPKGIPEIVG